jgi:hypothetical protein
LTDAISAGYIGGRGLLVSDRFKKLLQKFNLTNHIFIQQQSSRMTKPISIFGCIWLIQISEKMSSSVKQNFQIPKTEIERL